MFCCMRHRANIFGAEYFYYPKGHFPPDGMFRAERHFVLFEDQLAESGRQKTKENVIPSGKFRPVENGLNSSIHQTLIGSLR